MGPMAVSEGSRFGLTRWSAAADPFSRTQMDGDHEALETKATGFLRDIIANRPAAAAENVGFLFEATDENSRLYWSTGAAWVPIGASAALCAVKSVDESVASSTALQADDELTLPVEANTRYAFRAVIVLAGGSAEDAKLQFVLPTGATASVLTADPIEDAGSSPQTWYHRQETEIPFSGAQTIPLGGSTKNIVLWLEGAIAVGANPGTVALQWAQNAAGATSTTVLAGSSITLTPEVLTA